MSTVIFKTEEATFQFDRKPVMKLLEHQKTSYEIQELDTLIQVLSSQPYQTILSSAENPYFAFIKCNNIQDLRYSSNDCSNVSSCDHSVL